MWLLGAFEKIGASVIGLYEALYEVLHFTFVCLIHALNPKSYNPAMVSVLVRQIYFTAVEIIPLFMILAILFGSVIVGVVLWLAMNYSLQNEIGAILVTFVVDEFAPFFTALLISLRSGAAINTEIAVMRVNNELNTLKTFNIDVIDYLFLPRIIAGILSMIFLSFLFAILMLLSGYIFTFLFLNFDFYSYTHMIISDLDMRDFVILLLKSLAFGFVTMLIPLYSGLKTQKSYTAIPVSVLHGMVKLFIAIFMIEVVSLLVQLL